MAPRERHSALRLLLAARGLVSKPFWSALVWISSTAGFYVTYLAAWDATRPVAQPLHRTQAFKTALPMFTAFLAVGLVILAGALPSDRLTLAGHPRRSWLLRRARRRRLLPFAAVTGVNLLSSAALLVAASFSASPSVAEYVALGVNAFTLLAMVASVGWGERFLAHRIHDPHRHLVNALAGWIPALLAAAAGGIVYHAWFWAGWGG
jgi:hypothetical protein